MSKINAAALAYIQNPNEETFLPFFGALKAIGNRTIDEYPLVVKWVYFIYPKGAVKTNKRTLRFFFSSTEEFIYWYPHVTSREDLLQDGYDLILRKLHRYRTEGGSFWNWATYVFRRAFWSNALNVLRNYYRMDYCSSGWLDPEESNLPFEEVEFDTRTAGNTKRYNYYKLSPEDILLFKDPNLENLERVESSRELWKAIARLGKKRPRFVEVLFKYYGLCNHPEMVFQEIANEWGVSRQRIGQVEEKALKRLRKMVCEDVF